MDTPYGLTEADQVLAAELYHKVTPRVIRVYTRKWPGHGDTIVSAAGLGVVLAVRDWRPGEGLTLEAYADYRATMQVRSDLYFERRRLKAPVTCWSDLDRLRAQAARPDPGPLWEAMTAYLSPKELETVRQLYIHDRGIVSAAHAMGVKVGTADKRRRSALDRLRVLVARA